MTTKSSENLDFSEYLKTNAVDWPSTFVTALYLLLAVGTASFLFGIFTSNHARAWQIYLVNFLFWSGLSVAGVIISATWHIVGAQWGAVFKRTAEAMAAFLPISFILFLILFWGRHDWIPWLEHPDPHKTPWLNLPLFFFRNAFGLLLLYGMSFYYLYLSLRPDVGAAVEHRVAEPDGMRHWLAKDWKGLQQETAHRDGILRWYSVALVVVYGLVFSLLGFDFVMSLDRHFYSTLFGIYFFVSNLYMGFAALGALIAFQVRRGNLGKIATASHLHDQGKLTFAFCMLTGYMLFVQFLVIWYGNLPEEIGFLLHRISDRPWRFLSPIAALVAVVIPLCVMLSRSLKKKPMGLFVMGICILVGMWLERFILVVPSLWQGDTLPLGWMEIAVTAGFFAAALLCYRVFTRNFPMVAVTDRLFPKTLHFHTH
jgi:Ni/Fe-hydrogenase subunit HybB-like protein